MKLQHLLQQRSALLRQTRLANVAYVYAELGKFGERIARGKLRGLVTLYLADPAAQRAWPSLIAEEGSQAVIDEHFVDEDILDLAEFLLFTGEDQTRGFLSFRLEEFNQRFRPTLLRELQAAGVELTGDQELTEDRSRD